MTLEILLDCQWKRNKLSQTYESSGISIFWKPWKLEPPPTHPIKNFRFSRAFVFVQPKLKNHQCHNFTSFIFLNFLSNQTGTQKQYKDTRDHTKQAALNYKTVKYRQKCSYAKTQMRIEIKTNKRKYPFGSCKALALENHKHQNPTTLIVAPIQVSF